jgi:hypothetical protein
MCPNPHTTAPSMGPKKSAAKKPGDESRASEPIGLGIFMSEPTALRAVNMARRAVRQAGVVWRMLVFISSLDVWVIFVISCCMPADNNKSVPARITDVVCDEL